jgi:hypothetical protein
MANQYEDDDEDTFDGDPTLPRKLRAQIKQLSAQVKTLEERNGTLEGTQRTRVIADVLASKGANPRIATYVPPDIEATEESVAAWLVDNADVFGLTAAPPAQGSAVDPAMADQLRRMAVVEQGYQPSVSGDLLAQIENAQNEDELMALVRGGQ